MSDPAARARDLFGEHGYLCAESVLLALSEHLDIDSPLIPRIATGLCSGFARTKGPCGAFTGAVLAINLAYGRDNPDTPCDVGYEQAVDFMEAFRKRFGSDNCFELTGCDFNTPEGIKRFSDGGVKEEQCAVYVEEAVRMALEVLAQSGRL